MRIHTMRTEGRKKEEQRNEIMHGVYFHWFS
jgi:hypothetical protein